MKPTLAPFLPRLGFVALLAALAALPALAQYKVVQPDGSVTYTDRPPNAPNARVTPLGRYGVPLAPEVGLPLELRQAVQRYPVVLYAAADCAPCDSGRRLLQQRGVPYSERRIVTEDDAAALERAVGGRTLPALTIGAQALRGLSETDWGAFLDAAGYPRESRLPRNWPVPEALPMTERLTPARPASATAAPEPRPAESGASGGLRF
jgi:glutaredoxin